MQGAHDETEEAPKGGQSLPEMRSNRISPVPLDLIEALMPIVRVKMGTAMLPSRRLPVFLVGAFPITLMVVSPASSKARIGCSANVLFQELSGC